MKKLSIIFIFILCFGIPAFAQNVPLKILERPSPELPKNYGTLDVQGTVILRIEFLEFGEIGEISPVKTLPGGLTEKAIAAARKIKFETEKKDGKPVTVFKQIEYSYSWNGGWRLPADRTSPVLPANVESGKAEAIIAKAVQMLGGDRYLQVKSQIGRGKFSVIRESAVISFQTFSDVLIFPDKERTDFKGKGSRTIQVNTGNTGWIFDGDQDLIKVQNDGQIQNFKQGIRTSLDNLLRGIWKGDAELSYSGRRASTLGKRNDVVKLTYKDDFVVEFEFSDDGLPQKALYKRVSGAGEETKDEDHYAQFIEVDGIKTPFIVDRFSDGKPSSRINYESIEFNKSIPDSIFTKPANAKDAKKDIRY